jgi:DnaK suppressor protein
MRTIDVESCRTRLEAELREVVSRVAAVETELGALAEELDVELMDRAQEERLVTLLAALDEQERREAEEINAALERLAAGVYGICEACGQPIDVERLEALPSARRCAACQEREEG